MKKVFISIKGLQDHIDSGSDVMEFLTDGDYSYSDDKILFSYMESELTGMQGTKTTFLVENGQVTLTREGELSSQMLFCNGRRHNFLYNTPVGGITIGVDTYKISSRFGEHGGDLEVAYTMFMDNAALGQNCFKINVREAQ